MYYFEEGMTFRDWVNSEYNIDGFYIVGLGGAPIHFEEYSIGLDGEYYALPITSESDICINYNYVLQGIFYIDGTMSYVFNKDMTWEQFINSYYNNSLDFKISDNSPNILYDYNQIYLNKAGYEIYKTDIIIPEHNYYSW